MLKRLDKYMDNLKSPYWEVYFWIIVIAFGIAGTVVIFTDPMGLANKFGNAGSFLGGLFTIAAVVVAVIAYKRSKIEHKESLLFEIKSELEIEFLPELKILLKENINELRKCWNEIRKNEGVRHEKQVKVIEIKSKFELLKKQLEQKTMYLYKLGGLRERYREAYNDFKILLDIIIDLCGAIEEYNNGGSSKDKSLESRLIVIRYINNFFYEYITYDNNLEHVRLFKYVEMSSQIDSMIRNVEKYYNLHPN